jgi:hypothetical protein
LIRKLTDHRKCEGISRRGFELGNPPYPKHLLRSPPINVAASPVGGGLALIAAFRIAAPEWRKPPVTRGHNSPIFRTHLPNFITHGMAALSRRSPSLHALLRHRDRSLPNARQRRNIIRGRRAGLSGDRVSCGSRLFSNSGVGCQALHTVPAGLTVLSAVGAEPSA